MYVQPVRVFEPSTYPHTNKILFEPEQVWLHVRELALEIPIEELESRAIDILDVV